MKIRAGGRTWELLPGDCITDHGGYAYCPRVRTSGGYYDRYTGDCGERPIPINSLKIPIWVKQGKIVHSGGPDSCGIEYYTVVK